MAKKDYVTPKRNTTGNVRTSTEPKRTTVNEKITVDPAKKIVAKTETDEENEESR